MQKRYNLENICSKNSIRALRYFFKYPYMPLGITEIAQQINISRSNIYRAIEEIQKIGLVIQLKTGKKKLYRVDASSHLAELFFFLFSAERYMNLPSKLKNTLDIFRKEYVCKTMILFGSFAQGLDEKYSDVDICVVAGSGKVEQAMRKGIKDFYPDLKFELHFYNEDKFRKISDFVILDSLLNGISFAGANLAFQALSQIQDFPKSYLLYRLQNCEGYLEKVKKVSGPAKKYFKSLVAVSLGEISALIKIKTTVPKKAIDKVNLSKEINELHDELSKRGDKIWLI